jgi:hypothetical protein
MARAVKSGEELAEVRDAMDIIVDGFWTLVAAYQPGKTEAEIMAPAVELFFARGAGPRMMNILLSGVNGEADAYFKIPGLRKVAARDLLLYSLEVTGAGGYWVEFSRPLIQGKPSPTTQKMAEPIPTRWRKPGSSCAQVSWQATFTVQLHRRLRNTALLWDTSPDTALERPCSSTLPLGRTAMCNLRRT